MKVAELKPGMRRVEVEGRIVEKGEPRQVQTRFGDTSRVADAVLTDDSGSIKMSLWNEQIDSFNVNDDVHVENGYVTSFRGEPQLNVGRYGRLTLKQQQQKQVRAFSIQRSVLRGASSRSSCCHERRRETG